MRYAGIIKNDIAAAPGLCLTVFVQGCPLNCLGCHNPEAQDFSGGYEFTNDTLNEIISGINANGIIRPLCIMGGEPLCDENSFLTYLIIDEVRRVYPDLPIYIWTGYTWEELQFHHENRVLQILDKADYLIDGPFILALKNLTLNMRGSSNQRIINLTKTKKYGKLIVEE